MTLTHIKPRENFLEREMQRVDQKEQDEALILALAKKQLYPGLMARTKHK